jgi:transcriptional regulator with XRE-family HTH domain
VSSEPIQDDGRATGPLRNLGASIRSGRRRLGISISELARRSGLSQSFLSAVEAGQSDISVGRLMRVAHVLGVPLSDLIETTATPGLRVVRAGERTTLPSAAAALRIELLAPSLDGLRTYAECTLEPGAEVEPIATPGLEDFITVSDGAVRLEFANGETLDLAAGDSISYADDELRRVTNLVPRRTMFFWVSAHHPGRPQS